jgi:thiol-disulfide isomerase/thioredoxin
MRFYALFAPLFAALSVSAQTPASILWSELKAKRESLPSLHQEFDFSRTYRSASGNQASKQQIVLDMAQGQWRERSISGSGDYIRIFDGQDLFRMEEGGDEFVRIKRRPKDDVPLPSPYGFGEPDWSKAVELERLPCGIPGYDHACVILEMPLKRRATLPSSSDVARMVEGSAKLSIDLETGLILSLRTVQQMERGTVPYQSDLVYVLKRMSYGKPADTNLFKLPSNGLREVKELSPWNAARIKKQLAGKPAPELTVTDIQGNPVALSAFKGKTVLLDFWTTWCPPCRADGPALDKLYRKYGGQDLMIVGISVSEERAIVEKFLREHPHSFPIALTTENDTMPRPYQVGVLPTYIVIDRDGTVNAAAQGDQGFSELRKLLKKAGLEVE